MLLWYTSLRIPSVCPNSNLWLCLLLISAPTANYVDRYGPQAGGGSSDTMFWRLSYVQYNHRVSSKGSGFYLDRDPYIAPPAPSPQTQLSEQTAAQSTENNMSSSTGGKCPDMYVFGSAIRVRCRTIRNSALEYTADLVFTFCEKTTEQRVSKGCCCYFERMFVYRLSDLATCFLNLRFTVPCTCARRARRGWRIRAVLD